MPVPGGGESGPRTQFDYPEASGPDVGHEHCDSELLACEEVDCTVLRGSFVRKHADEPHSEDAGLGCEVGVTVDPHPHTSFDRYRCVSVRNDPFQSVTRGYFEYGVPVLVNGFTLLLGNSPRGVM